MRQYGKSELEEIIKRMAEGMTAAGFTDVKIESAVMSEDVWKGFVEELDFEEEEGVDAASFSEECNYHRVVTGQGQFGFWLQPYPVVDLSGTGLDAKAFYPADEVEEVPDNLPFVGMHENVFQDLYTEFAKKSRQP